MAQELLETVKPPQTSRNRAIHLARISGAISTYRNWIWLTWSFHEHFLPSTSVAIAGKYWGRAPTAIHSARINHNGVVPKARHRFRRMSLLRVVFSLQKQNLQRISGFYHASLWSGRFRVFEVSEVDIILAGHDHHYDVKPVGPHGTYACSSRLIFGSPTQVVGWEYLHENLPAPFTSHGFICFFSTILLTPQKEAKIGKKHRLNAAHEVLKSGTDFRDITAGSWECSR